MKSPATPQSPESKKSDRIYNIGYASGQRDLFIPMLVCGIICIAGGYILALAIHG